VASACCLCGVREIYHALDSAFGFRSWVADIAAVKMNLGKNIRNMLICRLEGIIKNYKKTGNFWSWTKTHIALVQ
jgi:hypothetical protein